MDESDLASGLEGITVAETRLSDIDGQAGGLEAYLNTVVDHGLNASTFAARVVISTESDVTSAVTAAVGALKGSLHGGAPGPVLDMTVPTRSGMPVWVRKNPRRK